MTLYELFHPLVTYIAEQRSLAAAGRPCGQEAMYAHLMRDLERIRKTGSAESNVAPLLEEACTYTAFFVDYMVHEGPFPFSHAWQDLGRSMYNELAGDEKFFDFVQAHLEDETADSLQHVELLYDMLVCGFSGALERRSVRLESLMRRCAEKLSVPREEAAKRALFDVRPTSSGGAGARNPRLKGYALLGGAAVLLAGSVCFYLHSFHSATEDLRDVLDHTIEAIVKEARQRADNSGALVVSHVRTHDKTDKDIFDEKRTVSGDRKTEEPAVQAPAPESETEQK